MMLLNIEYKEPDNMTSRTPVACLQPLQNVFTMGFQYTAWGGKTPPMKITNKNYWPLDDKRLIEEMCQMVEMGGKF